MTTINVRAEGTEGWDIVMDNTVITLKWPSDLPPTAELFKSLPWGEIAQQYRQAHKYAMYEACSAGLPAFRRRAGAVKDDEFDDALRTLYRRAVAAQLSPAKTLAWHYRISDRTAERWLIDARKRGTLKSLTVERELAKLGEDA